MNFTNYNSPDSARLRRGKRFAMGTLRAAGRNRLAGGGESGPDASGHALQDASRLQERQPCAPASWSAPSPSAFAARQSAAPARRRLALFSQHAPPATRHSSLVTRAGFTMIEIALCLAIIGFALVSILLVLPSGMNTQRDTREETIINQDASVLMEAIRDGAHGLDDLTNYVYAITNYWTVYNPNGTVNNSGVDGYTYSTASPQPRYRINSGARIIGLLSTPEFTDGSLVPAGPTNGVPIPSLYFGGTSNHVVAYVRSFSGLAAEKPPQDNQIMQADTFGYRVVVVNAPMAADTNTLIDLLPNNWPLWQSGLYSKNAQVFYNWTRWRAISNIVTGDLTPPPGQPVPTNWQSSQWVEAPYYPLALARNQRELRLYFEWPQLPNGNVGGFRQNFRVSIAGQLVQTNDPTSSFNTLGSMGLYFYEPQFFSSTP